MKAMTASTITGSLPHFLGLYLREPKLLSDRIFLDTQDHPSLPGL
jgi:hypothetical protein